VKQLSDDHVSVFFRLTQLNASHNAWYARCGHCLN